MASRASSKGLQKGERKSDPPKPMGVQKEGSGTLLPDSREGVHLFLSIPSANGYSQKLVPDLPLHQLITKYQFLLPPGSVPKHFHFFHNGLRLMDEERKLSSYGVKPMGTIELKRDLECELIDITDNAHYFITDVSVVDAAKQLSQTIWSTKIKNWSVYNYDLYASRGSLVLMEPEKKFMACRFINGEEIEIRVVPKQGGNTGTRRLRVIYSPLTAREEQQKNLVRTGWLKKQGGGGGGSKNWKERWFVLDAEKVCYYENEKKKKALGTIYLDEITETSPERSLNEANPSKFYMYISVPGRKLLINTKDEESFKGWLQSLNCLCALSHAENVFLTPEERAAKEHRRATDPTAKRMTGTLAASQQRGISGPYNAAHLTHISTDWKWTGDVSVFKMEEILGRGASGIVYKATVRDVGFEVAVKIVKSENTRAQEELEKEIDVLKQCKHPNVVAYYGTKIQHDTNDVWIIMDYCGVGSVKDLITISGDLLAEEQLAYTLQGTLKGLVHLHARGILHLDIKSANILVNVDGVVKLADFGVSEKLKNGFVIATDFVGSPLFMSPEVIKKDKYDNRTDIWSLGITMIEMVEGKPPNTDINSIEKLPLIIERPPPKFKQERKWSQIMIDFLARCLVKDFEARSTSLQLLSDPFVAPSNVRDPKVLSDLIQITLQIQQSKRVKV